MFWQQEYVRENVAMDLNGSYRLELPKEGMLGSLVIRITGAQAADYGVGGGAWRIIDNISKISVLLNGSDPCKSFTGLQCGGISFFDQGVMLPADWRNYATNTQAQYLLVNFGRWMFDSSFGLDLAKYGTVELQIENIATAAAFSDLTVSVLGFYLRGAPAGRFQGYMETKLWKSWTTVQNETVYSDLPVDHTLRRIILQAKPALDADNVEDTDISNIMDDIDFSLDTGQTRLYKGGIDDIVRWNYLAQGKVAVMGASPYHTADKGIDISMGRLLGYAQGAGSQDGAGAATIPTLESARTGRTLKPETKEADSPMNLLVAGMAPFNCVNLDFDVEYDPSMWLDTSERKVVKLDIHTRDSSSADNAYAAIILDRLRRA